MVAGEERREIAEIFSIPAFCQIRKLGLSSFTPQWLQIQEGGSDHVKLALGDSRTMPMDKTFKYIDQHLLIKHHSKFIISSILSLDLGKPQCISSGSNTLRLDMRTNRNCSSSYQSVDQLEIDYSRLLVYRVIDLDLQRSHLRVPRVFHNFPYNLHSLCVLPVN